MIGLLRAMLKVIGVRTLIVFALLCATLAVIAQGINSLVRELDVALLLRVMLVGMLITWLCARSKMRGWLALPLIALCGLSYIVIDIGQLYGKLGVLFQALNGLVEHIKYWDPGVEITVQPLIGALSDLGTSLGVMASRTSAWVANMTTGRSTFDPVASSIVWCALLWGIACWAIWAIRRNGNALWAMSPLILFQTGLYAYTGAEMSLLVWPAFVLVILLALVSHHSLEKRWQARGIDYSEDIRFDIALIVTPISVALVGAAYLVPSVSIQDLANAAQEAVRAPAQQAKPLPDSLGLKPKPLPAPVVVAPTAAGLPRSHLLGSGSELSHETVMLVSTGDLPPMPQSVSEMYQIPPRYYWRNAIYDRYTGGGWATSDTQSTDYPAGEDVVSSTVQATRLVRQDVQVKTDLGGLVYQAGTLMAADRDVKVYYRTNKDVFSSAFIRTTDAYKADSLVSTATVEQLRSVKADYPDWIRTRYLQLPDSVPQRVLSLARDLTATAPTPYDRAAAIESYLRTYSYTLDLPAPPLGRDVADYFLFDLKRGYCDYYATAMVVLARASGLPARMVVGYAAGSYDPMRAEYVVSQADAHSWPEIYFNEYGWIEFEPTSGRVPIVRDTTSPLVAGSSTQFLPPLQPRITLLDELDWVIPLALGLLAVLIVGGFNLFDYWRLSRKPPHEVAGLLLGRVYVQGRKLNVRARPSDTALEYTSTLAQRVIHLAPVKAQRVVVQATADLDCLAEMYQRSAYSPHAISAFDRYQALRAWQRVRLRLWQAWVWKLHAQLGQHGIRL
jgi:transglutaminase-like putative cysteine protease